MDIDSTFTVAAPIDEVWAAIMDIESVTGCIPGAEVLNKLNDDAYQIGMKVKLGPVSLQYRGQLNVLERDASARRAVLQGTAKETRGQGTAQATVVLQLEEAGSGTQGLVSADIGLSGKAAAMGKGVIGGVTEQLMAVFAANLEELVNSGSRGAPEAAAAASAASGPGPSEPGVPEPAPTPGAAQTPVPGGPHTGGPAAEPAPAGVSASAAAAAPGGGPGGPGGRPGPARRRGPAREEPPRPTPLASVRRIDEAGIAEPVPAAGRAFAAGAPGADGLDGLALARGMLGEKLRHPAVQLWLYTAVAVIAYQLGRRAARYGG